MKNSLIVGVLSLSLFAQADGKIEQRRKEFSEISKMYSISSKTLDPKLFDANPIWSCTSYEMFGNIAPINYQVHFGPSRLAGYVDGGIARWTADRNNTVSLGFFPEQGNWVTHNISYGVIYLRGNNKKLILETVPTPGMFSMTWQVLCESSEKNCVLADSVSSQDHNVFEYTVCNSESVSF